ncbi:MAG TPA: beta-propeller fold lactonase family protein [Verrucomicrobiae bacterium]|nr:beta-propeller fold lactonase family protein [Verrucomicrobiae bacterium]
MKQSRFAKYLNWLGLSAALGSAAALADDSVIYTMDNAASANHVLVFHAGEHGAPKLVETVPTGGTGTGAGLSSQGSVLLTRDGRWLFVCNAGSDEVSVFAAGNRDLHLAQKVHSGGHLPLSLTLHRNLLYVLNAGGSVGDKDNITAFAFANGSLFQLSGSTRALSADNTGPAQVSFTQDGDALVVTERNTNLIDTFPLGDDGLAMPGSSFASAGQTPFGFAVGHRDRIFVSEAGGGAANASSASSYSISDTGELTVISGAVPTRQTAACWLTLTHDGRFIYTANAGSGTLSGYGVAPDGTLHLLDPNGITASTGPGSHPVDMAEGRDGRMLFALANGNGTLGAFRLTGDGGLQPLGFAGGIATSAAGLAAQ